MLPEWKAKKGPRPLKALLKGLKYYLTVLELSNKSWPNGRSAGQVPVKYPPSVSQVAVKYRKMSSDKSVK